MRHRCGRHLVRWHLRGEVLVSAKTMSREAQGISDVRRPLHSTFGHRIVRVMFGSVLAVWSASLPVALVVGPKLTPRDLLVLVAMLLAIALLARVTFRTRAIYGSSRGLEYRENGQWRRIPWRHVGPPEYNTLRSALFFYEAHVEVEGEEPRKIWFQATKGDLDELQRMRAAALAEMS